jgi:hypothetical protein
LNAQGGERISAPMRREIILHIGISKTGTSSIQRALAAVRPALGAAGIHYPSSPGHANHGLLPMSLVPLAALRGFNPLLWEGLGPEARLARFRAEFAAEMAALPAGATRVVFSAEQCAGLLNSPERVAALHALLAPHAAAFRVIVYLRRQDRHFASGYVQSMRVGHVVPPGFGPGGEDGLYDYAALLERWADVFGAAAVTPRIFEPESLAGGDVVDDFLDAIGAPGLVPADAPERRSNLSISPGAIALVLALAERLRGTRPAALSPDSLLWRRVMQRVSEVLPGKGWRPTPAEARDYLARFEHTNEAVRARWFPGRASLFAPVEEDRAAAMHLGAEPALDAATRMLLAEVEAGMAREVDLQLQIARLHERTGEREKARSRLRAVLRQDDAQPDAHLNLGRLALEDGDRAAAERHLGSLQRAHPEHAATQRLARLLRVAARTG